MISLEHTLLTLLVFPNGVLYNIDPYLKDINKNDVNCP